MTLKQKTDKILDGLDLNYGERIAVSQALVDLFKSEMEEIKLI